MDSERLQKVKNIVAENKFRGEPIYIGDSLVDDVLSYYLITRGKAETGIRDVEDY